MEEWTKRGGNVCVCVCVCVCVGGFVERPVGRASRRSSSHAQRQRCGWRDEPCKKGRGRESVVSGAKARRTSG